MTDTEIRAKSAAKMKQIFDLMKLLQIEPEGVQKLDNQGILRSTVLWMDLETYPKDPAPAVVPPATPVPEAEAAGGKEQ